MTAIAQSTPGMEVEFKVAQIGLHRAISGHSLAASLDHLTAAAKQVEKDAQSRQEAIRVGKIPDAELIISADVRFAGEAVLHIIGSAVVQAQKQIGSITGLVKDIGEACVRFGYGALTLTGQGSVARTPRLRTEKTDAINGVANLWKHEHEDPIRPATVAAVSTLGVNANDPDAFSQAVVKLGIDGPNYNFISLWNEINDWGKALIDDLHDDLEQKQILMLTTLVESHGVEIWNWKRRGSDILSYDFADMWRSR
jgi:hypothetical protein